jgi:hypothetical protein
VSIFFSISAVTKHDDKLAPGGAPTQIPARRPYIVLSDEHKQSAQPSQGVSDKGQPQGRPSGDCQQRGNQTCRQPEPTSEVDAGQPVLQAAEPTSSQSLTAGQMANHCRAEQSRPAAASSSRGPAAPKPEAVSDSGHCSPEQAHHQPQPAGSNNRNIRDNSQSQAQHLAVNQPVPAKKFRPAAGHPRTIKLKALGAGSLLKHKLLCAAGNHRSFSRSTNPALYAARKNPAFSSGRKSPWFYAARRSKDSFAGRINPAFYEARMNRDFSAVRKSPGFSVSRRSTDPSRAARIWLLAKPEETWVSPQAARARDFTRPGRTHSPSIAPSFSIPARRHTNAEGVFSRAETSRRTRARRNQMLPISWAFSQTPPRGH